MSSQNDRQNRNSTKAACLGLLVLIVAMSAGCLSSAQYPIADNLTYQNPPEVGSYVDENLILTATEKWRVWEGGGTGNWVFDLVSEAVRIYPISEGYSYHARLSNGDEFYVYPDTYPSIIVGQTALILGRINVIYVYYPVNVTRYSDVKNRMLVVP